MSPLAPSAPSKSWNGLITLRVSFPDIATCVDGEAYEEIGINVHRDTVKQVKKAIATKLGIEADEFVFYHKPTEKEYKSESNKLFAKAYIRGNYISYVEGGCEMKPLKTGLYKSKFYKGKTGILEWMLRQTEDCKDCLGHHCKGGRLAEVFARDRATFKALRKSPSA